MKIVASAIVLALAILALAPRPPAAGDREASRPTSVTGQPNHASQPTQSRPRIEVVFALDTTGSMSGLIDGAKAKIWSIARALSEGQPRPEIAIGLVAYRDLGDEYVTRTTPLTTDLDAVYRDLMALTAEGGGDGPEHVNRALAVATREIAWSEREGVTRLVFLVGDAPAHMDYPQDTPWTTTVEDAVRKGIVVNTVRCGGDADTAAQWNAIARRGEGRFVSLEQDGGMQIVATPLDERLGELRRELASTYLPFGGKKEREDSLSRSRAAEAVAAAAPAPAAADRAAFLATSGTALGADDLADGVARGSVDLGRLDPSDLPAELAGMKPEEQKAKLAAVLAERQALTALLAVVATERDEYLAKKAATAPAAGAFNQEVLAIVREQAAKNGVKY
jgi:Mg-chelatase subunit ChlD